MLDKLSSLKTCSPSSTGAWSSSLEATLLAASDAASSQIGEVKHVQITSGVVKVRIQQELRKAPHAALAHVELNQLRDKEHIQT